MSNFSISTKAQNFFLQITGMTRLLWQTLLRIPLLFKNINLTINQMKVIGVESLPLVAITAIFIGAETVVQANLQFNGLIPLSYLGFVVSKSIITELGPVLTAFVVASRISTAIAAEVGSMKTTEQLDAMYCLSLDSTRYIIMPKVVATFIMMPVMVIFAELLAFCSSTVTAIFFTEVSLYTYIEGLRLFFSVPDMMIGIAKTTIFGLIIALSGAHFGLECSKGAEGIGNSTTNAFMLSSILILVFDFIVAILFM